MTRFVDLANKRFGKLVAVSPTAERRNRGVVWLCRCDCGNQALVTNGHLQSGGTESCGCLEKPFLDRSGERFGRLVVVRRAEDGRNRSMRWHCLCDCGKDVVVYGVSLLDGSTRSCGCFARERDWRIKHGMTYKDRSPPKVYRAWVAMKQRCYNRNATGYENYGGRGVQVCERWLNSFENFFSDMGHPPSPQHSLDRFPNVNGHYEPSNCRWATKLQQTKGRRPRAKIIADLKAENARLTKLVEMVRPLISGLCEEIGL